MSIVRFAIVNFMLQRIQTVYLLIIVVLTIATLFLPLAVWHTGGEFFSFDASGVSSVGDQPELIYPTWSLFILTAAIALIALITIFLYKKRILQIRLRVFNALLMLGFYGLFAFLAWIIKDQLSDAAVSVKIGLCFPLINLILDYLAIRNIGADEALVRSLDRLR